MGGSPELQKVTPGMTEAEVEALFGGRKGEPFTGDVGDLHFVPAISIIALPQDVQRSMDWSGSDGLMVVDFDQSGRVVGRRFFAGNLF
jgi:hypothetical protein